MSLKVVISSFSSEDYSKFIKYLQKKNRRTDAKNIALFKLLYANKLSSDEICETLYTVPKKEAYHALRKRLYDALIDFIATSKLEDDDTDKMAIIKYIMVGKLFLQQDQYKIGFKLLNKAEVIAKEYLLYPYLNEIYQTKIQFSYFFDEEHLDSFITAFKNNQKKYLIEEKLSIVYAKIRQLLHKISYKGEVVDFQEIVTELLNKENITINESLSFKSLYQLLSIASISAFITKDYLQIESFMIHHYEILKNNPSKEKERFYHVQVLYMIANTMFRVKKFERSLYFLDLMKDELQKTKSNYSSRFTLKHKLLKALNLNYSNQQDLAIRELEPLLKKKFSDLETTLDIYLSLVVFYFQKGEIKESYKQLSKLYHTDKWYTEKAGKEWVIKKNLIEILLLVELNYLDVFESRVLSFKRQYSAYLKDLEQDRVIVFLNFVIQYFNNPKQATTKEFIHAIETSFEWVGTKREDIFVMSFYAWLKAKTENKTPYRVTLELISKAQNL